MKYQMCIEQEKKIQSLYASLKTVMNQNLTNDEMEQFLEWSHIIILDTSNERKKLELLKQIRKIQYSKNADDIQKVAEMKIKKKKYEPKNYPKNITIGDIVYVHYGFPYCNEISEGHYGIVMSEIQGSSFLIIPLSSEPYNKFKYSFIDLKLPNKKGIKEEKISYALFNQSKYIHYRRLECINGCGKRNIGDKVYDLCENYLRFLNMPTRQK